jgi:hypothetical protein
MSLHGRRTGGESRCLESGQSTGQHAGEPEPDADNPLDPTDALFESARNTQQTRLRELDEGYLSARRALLQAAGWISGSIHIPKGLECVKCSSNKGKIKTFRANGSRETGWLCESWSAVISRIGTRDALWEGYSQSLGREIPFFVVVLLLDAWN